MLACRGGSAAGMQPPPVSSRGLLVSPTLRTVPITRLTDNMATVAKEPLLQTPLPDDGTETRWDRPHQPPPPSRGLPATQRYAPGRATRTLWRAVSFPEDFLRQHQQIRGHILLDQAIEPPLSVPQAARFRLACRLIDSFQSSTRCIAHKTVHSCAASLRGVNKFENSQRNPVNPQTLQLLQPALRRAPYQSVSSQTRTRLVNRLHACILRACLERQPLLRASISILFATNHRTVCDGRPLNANGK